MSRAAPIAEPLFRKEDATPISSDEDTVKPWSEGQACLESAPKVWLATARPNNRPHVAPVLVVWLDEAPHFTTRPGSRKGRNLADNPECVLSVSSEQLDLVLEGAASPQREHATLVRIANAYEAKYDWQFAIRDGVAHDDSLPGSPEYAFYRVEPSRAFGYGPDGLTATRWRFR